MNSTMKPKTHFLIMGGPVEELNSPIHIHYDSFKPAFTVNPKAALSPGTTFDAIGTFLVTLTSPNFAPKGHTCRVSGVNHKLTSQGTANGVIAHVEMVIDVYGEPLERAYIELREGGVVVGFRDIRNEVEPVDLNDVYFSYGDTTFLDGEGNPFDERHKPQPTEAQRNFMSSSKGLRN